MCDYAIVFCISIKQCAARAGYKCVLYGRPARAARHFSSFNESHFYFVDLFVVARSRHRR